MSDVKGQSQSSLAVGKNINKMRVAHWANFITFLVFSKGTLAADNLEVAATGNGKITTNIGVKNLKMQLIKVGVWDIGEGFSDLPAKTVSLR